MTTTIDAFKRSVQTGADVSVLRLTDAGLCQDGKVRAALSFRSTHRKTIMAFLDALYAAYGETAYRMAQGQLDARLRRGQPLTVSKVKSIVSAAESLVDLQRLNRFCSGMGGGTLDEALAHWFRFHPADPPFSEEELKDLKFRLEIALRVHRPPFPGAWEMKMAIEQGKLEPLCRFQQAMDANLADDDLEAAFNQRLAYRAAAGESIPFAGTHGEFRLNNRDRRSLRRDIEARLARVSAGGTALPQVAEGAGLRKMKAEEIAAWVGEIRAQALDDYIARMSLIADPLLGLRAEEWARLGLTEAAVRREHAAIAALVFENATDAARMLDEDAWRQLIETRKHRLVMGVRIRDCLDWARPDSPVQQAFDACAAAAGFRVERDLAGHPGLRFWHPASGEVRRAISERLLEALARKMEAALNKTFAFGTAAAFDANRAAEVIQAELQDWFRPLRAIAGVADKNVAAGLLCNFLENMQILKADEVEALLRDTSFRIEADDLWRLVREGTPEAWKAYLSDAWRQIAARYDALPPELERSGDLQAEFAGEQMVMAVFALQCARAEARTLYRALHDASGAAMAACTEETADAMEDMQRQSHMSTLVALHYALGLYLDIPAARIDKDFAESGYPIEGNVYLEGAAEPKERLRRVAESMRAPPASAAAIMTDGKPLTLAQKLGKLACREAQCQAFLGKESDNEVRSSFVDGTAQSWIMIGAEMSAPGVPPGERYRRLAAFLFGPDAPDVLFPEGTPETSQRENWTRVKTVYLLAALCSRTLASPFMEAEAATMSPDFRMSSGAAGDRAALVVSLQKTAEDGSLELAYRYHTPLVACTGKAGAAVELNPAASFSGVRATLAISPADLAEIAARSQWAEEAGAGPVTPVIWPTLALRELEYDLCLTSRDGRETSLTV